MEIRIRKETEADFAKIYEVVKQSFIDVEHSDKKEHHLVDKLRKTAEFIPELALVAEVDREIVGYVLSTKSFIGNEEVLVLAPLSVVPVMQKKGIGSVLINETHKVAASLGYKSVIILGDPNYYSRFGYKPASHWNITSPFEIPDEYYMAIEIKHGSLTNIEGIVRYSTAFFE